MLLEKIAESRMEVDPVAIVQEFVGRCRVEERGDDSIRVAQRVDHRIRVLHVESRILGALTDQHRRTHPPGAVHG